MELYKNLSGSSKVHAYEIHPYSIWVQLKNGSNYLYTYESAGPIKVRMMQFLAVSGIGLYAFIRQFARDLYAVRSD